MNYKLLLLFILIKVRSMVRKGLETG